MAKLLREEEHKALMDELSYLRKKVAENQRVNMGLLEQIRDLTAEKILLERALQNPEGVYDGT